MSKFRFKGDNCYLNNDDLDDIRESTRSEAKQKKKNKNKNRENEFFSNYNKSKKSY